MKTYTRKRPEYQIIAEAEDLCRLCLKKAKQSIPIFTDDSGSMFNAKVALRIMICVGLEMSNEDCLPNNICIDCHNELERYYAFRKKCEVSYQKLKSHLLAVRIKEVSISNNINEDRPKKQDVEQTEKHSKETSNITFKVNFDGSIVVCNEKPSQIEEKPLVTLTRIKDNNQLKLLQSNKFTVLNHRILPRHTYQNNKLSQSSLLLPISTTTPVPTSVVMVPTSNVIVPASNVTVTASNVTVPASNVTLPACNATVPASNVTVPACNATVPTSNVMVPASNVTVLACNATVPASNVMVPASNVMVPASNVIVPASNVTVPEINTMVPECIELKSKELRSSEVIKKNETLEDVEVEVQNEVTDTDLSTFLSNLLIELGVLSQQGDELVLEDQEMRTVELETDDGRRVAWELVEEEQGVDSVEECVQNNQLNQPMSVTVLDDERKKNIVVQYASSNLEKENPEEVQKTAAAAPTQAGRAAGPGACCHVCGRGFASRSACARHVRDLHARARPHACRVCGHAFSQRVVMLRHELVHQAVRPHQCAQCPKSFTQRAALAAHLRAHAPPHLRALALYRCALCTKVFLYASGLTRHMVVHSGRRYQCDGCSRQFKDKSSLNRHIKNTNHSCNKPAKDKTAS